SGLTKNHFIYFCFMKLSRPLFIAFEGIDGSGKSTQARKLRDWLMANGNNVHLTAEPTKRPIGKMIRDIFSGQTKADERVIAGLFVADRLDHILNADEGMLSILKSGTTVISDRYYLSSYAYHGVHTDMNWVINANAMAAQLLRPDLTIFIDVTPEVAMERIKASRESVELYETLENLNAVRAKYMEAIEKVGNSENVIVIDGSLSEADVEMRIKEVIVGRK
ncbi:MAG: Thymidylate kinase, partial [Bacteroidota bacterium]